jgi:hypothetical protein
MKAALSAALSASHILETEAGALLREKRRRQWKMRVFS